MEAGPTGVEAWSMGARSLAYHLFNVMASTGLVIVGWIPPLVPAAYALMLIDAIEALLRPAIGVRPSSIGFRQLAASTVFFIVLIIAYL
jgi:hypothetical protein